MGYAFWVSDELKAIHEAKSKEGPYCGLGTISWERMEKLLSSINMGGAWKTLSRYPMRDRTGKAKSKGDDKELYRMLYYAMGPSMTDIPPELNMNDSERSRMADEINAHVVALKKITDELNLVLPWGHVVPEQVRVAIERAEKSSDLLGTWYTEYGSLEYAERGWEASLLIQSWTSLKKSNSK